MSSATVLYTPYLVQKLASPSPTVYAQLVASWATSCRPRSANFTSRLWLLPLRQKKPKRRKSLELDETGDSRNLYLTICTPARRKELADSRSSVCATSRRPGSTLKSSTFPSWPVEFT